MQCPVKEVPDFSSDKAKPSFAKGKFKIDQSKKWKPAVHSEDGKLYGVMKPSRIGETLACSACIAAYQAGQGPEAVFGAPELTSRTHFGK